jgi:hypothetical protein
MQNAKCKMQKEALARASFNSAFCILHFAFAARRAASRARAPLFAFCILHFAFAARSAA